MRLTILLTLYLSRFLKALSPLFAMSDMASRSPGHKVLVNAVNHITYFVFVPIPKGALPSLCHVGHGIKRVPGPPGTLLMQLTILLRYLYYSRFPMALVTYNGVACLLSIFL